MPFRDEVLDRGLIAPRTWQVWLNALRDAVVASATSTAVTALEATVTAINAAYQAADAALTAALTALTVRVSALETDWADATVDASFFSSATGSWTVGLPGDLIAYRYRRIGNTMQIAVRVNASSIGTTPAQLRIYLPGLVEIAEYATGVFWYANFTSGDDTAGIWFASPGVAYLALQRNAGGSANFANATNQFFIYLNAQCEVEP